jgi:hypothetical protein
LGLALHNGIAKEVEASFFSNFTAEEQESFNEYLLRSIGNLDSDQFAGNEKKEATKNWKSGKN